MKKLVLRLLLVSYVFMGVKVYGVQKQYCMGVVYTPGETAESFCKEHKSVAGELSGFVPKSTLYEQYNVCRTKYYDKAKNDYNSGKCKPINEVKYKNECGASCTKYNDLSGNTVSSFCTGGDASCVIKKNKKEDELFERKMKYTHTCIESGVSTSGKGNPLMSFRSLSLNPSLTAAQYCEADKVWGESSYKKCLSERNQEMNKYKEMNSNGNCYFVKRKTLEYGGIKCTIEYGEKDGKKVHLGTITEGNKSVSYKGTQIVNNDDKAKQCVKKLEAELFPSKSTTSTK